MTATIERTRLRDAVLDAASAEVASGGWPRLRMATVADTVGVTRRALATEFGSKPQLAAALLARSVDRLGELARDAFTTAADLRQGWHDAVLAVLRGADRDPVLGVVQCEVNGVDFLPLLTSRSDETVAHATTRLSAAAHARWPELDERRLVLAAHAAVRLTISHFLRPGPSYEHAAREISELIADYVTST